MDSQNNNSRIKLRLLGKITSGDKVGYKSLHIQPESIFTKWNRLIYNEDREGSMIFIENTINQVLTILEIESDENTKKDILKDLKASIRGLINLTESYHGDIKIVSIIESFIKKIERVII